jgi:hypothetical protein
MQNYTYTIWNVSWVGGMSLAYTLLPIQLAECTFSTLHILIILIFYINFDENKLY